MGTGLMLSRARVRMRQMAAPLVMRGADRLAMLHWELGIRTEEVHLPAHDVETDLVVWESHRMTALTRTRWLNMREAAAADGITLLVLSAFRDWEAQAEVLRRYLRVGKTSRRAMRTVAPPGYSEHHTGRALDISCPGHVPVNRHFAKTDAFAWLSARAGEFAFSMSYPRNNPVGIRFEPWHWCAAADASQSRGAACTATIGSERLSNTR
jgi:D-alanyl-D-alanine carboxypeptidase